MNILFKTFGCRLNQSETAVIKQIFESNNDTIVSNIAEADIAVINTCTVTENGDLDTIRIVKKISNTNPKIRIALIGCQAQIQKKNFQLFLMFFGLSAQQKK